MHFFQKINCFAVIGFLFLTISCQTNLKTIAQINPPIEQPKIARIKSPEIQKMLESAVEQTKLTKNYDPNYAVIAYPNGDVPMATGVCSDVVIRAFRRADVDLQQEVHEDMQAHFADYPQKWSLKSPDANIDHRRVPNLQTFFKRHGKSLPITEQPSDYQPGDVVAWDLNGKGMTHIGIVSNLYNASSKRYSIIHNIGGGATAEDAVFNWKIIGHYRYF